jgi:hypothetical protein
VVGAISILLILELVCSPLPSPILLASTILLVSNAYLGFHWVFDCNPTSIYSTGGLLVCDATRHLNSVHCKQVRSMRNKAVRLSPLRAST